MSLLEVENLSVEYKRNGRLVPAVDGVSFSVDAGQSFGLVGGSGSGKSTVVLSILRLIRESEGRISHGRIYFDGGDLTSLPEEPMRRVRGAEIAMIFQDPFMSLNPVLSVADQMRETLVAHGRESSTATLRSSLERVQLPAPRTLDSYPHQLSGGQRQRVMIAMALLCGPKLLLADEPTTALDVLVQKDILDLLFTLQKETGMALLLVSHNLPLVAHYTQKIAVMKAGKIIEAGETLELMRHPRETYTKQLWNALAPP